MLHGATDGLGLRDRGLGSCVGRRKALRAPGLPLGSARAKKQIDNERAAAHYNTQETQAPVDSPSQKAGYHLHQQVWRYQVLMRSRQRGYMLGLKNQFEVHVPSPGGRTKVDSPSPSARAEAKLWLPRLRTH